MRLSIWLGIASIVILSGCSKENIGPAQTNQPPETDLFAASPTVAGDSYSVEIAWSGSDPDGEVVGYHVSLDDTTSWHFTRSEESTLVFSAESDPEVRDATWTKKYHTFWVRAVDDRGALEAAPPNVTFTAASIAPITTVTRGPCERGYCGQCGTNILFEWTAIDPNGGQVDSFYYKLNVVGGLNTVVDSTWDRVGADCTYVRLLDVENLWEQTGRFNTFAVVAQDDDGVRERAFVHGRNWCCFDPWVGQYARIDIFDGVLGSRNNKVSGGPEHMSRVGEVFQGVEISFSWEASAAEYGANIIGYRYAYDDTSSWSAWDLDSTQYPPGGGTYVPSLGNHVLYVEAMDDLWVVSLCYFKFYVEAGPNTGDTEAVLVVDDSQYSGIPTEVVGAARVVWDPTKVDELEGNFYDAMLEGYTYTEWDCIEEGQDPPPVSLVGRYRNVIWYVDDHDGVGSELRDLFHGGTRYLDSYVRVGGNLIVMGWNPAWHLDPDCRPVSTYPFRFDTPCAPGQPVPISYTAFGLSELTYVPDDAFRGGVSLFPGQYPDLPLGEAWPFFAVKDTMYLWNVEAFDPDDINTNVNAIPVYDFNYFIPAGQDSASVVNGQHCALIVDNSGDPTTGSTAYFGWSPIFCDWDSVAAFMEEFLTNTCNEPPAK